ncbi:MAG: DcaP family trimeric outer membrane transporter [Elusimicrobiota bacterium]
MNKLLLPALLLFCASGQAAAEVTSKFKVDIYGFIKTDLIYSDHGTGTNEYRTYATTRADKAFRASARASRFGINISSNDNVSGKIEADFLGLTDSISGTAGTVADVRLRHAYLAFKTGKTEILAGQTFYPITADIPETLNDYYLGNSGALWSRAPQLRATYTPVKKLKLTAAVVRPSSKLTDAEGTHSALPGVQGKIEKELGKAKISLAGAAGVWKSTITARTADISAAVAAFNVPLAPFTVYGEAWAGRNLTDFLGGLGNPDYGAKAIPSKGGYLALKFKPADTLWFNLIYGVDDPKNARVAAKGKTRNATALANAVVKLYDCVETGVEISALNTEYKGLPDRSAMSYQLTLKLVF